MTNGPGIWNYGTLGTNLGADPNARQPQPLPQFDHGENNGGSRAMRLFHTATGKPVIRGDKVTDMRGSKAVVIGWREPEHEGSTGRIRVRNVDGAAVAEYYPSVFRCEFRVEQVKPPAGD